MAATLEKQGEPKPEHNYEFFDAMNTQARQLRDQLALESLEELIKWLKSGGRVAIHDATNSTITRRKMLIDRCSKENNLNVLFIESICNDASVLDQNIRLKLHSPDYRDMDPIKAREDFLARLENYEKSYETISEEAEGMDIQYCKLINVGKKVIAFNIQGFLAGQCIFYLMNMNLAKRKIWLTRHGESLDNVCGKIGGDAPLSQLGTAYAKDLAKFIEKQRLEEIETASKDFVPNTFAIWTSMSKRTIETVQDLDANVYDIKHLRVLNEIYAGNFEGLTYHQIHQQYPTEYSTRQANKLYYRYPGMGGESYVDVIQRINHVIVELERIENNVLIVSHRAIMRCLLAYLTDVPLEIMTNMLVPIHTLYCIEPQPYGNRLTKYHYDVDNHTFHREESE